MQCIILIGTLKCTTINYHTIFCHSLFMALHATKEFWPYQFNSSVPAYHIILHFRAPWLRICSAYHRILYLGAPWLRIGASWLLLKTNSSLMDSIHVSAYHREFCTSELHGSAYHIILLFGAPSWLNDGSCLPQFCTLRGFMSLVVAEFCTYYGLMVLLAT